MCGVIISITDQLYVGMFREGDYSNCAHGEKKTNMKFLL